MARGWCCCEGLGLLWGLLGAVVGWGWGCCVLLGLGLLWGLLGAVVGWGCCVLLGLGGVRARRAARWSGGPKKKAQPLRAIF